MFTNRCSVGVQWYGEAYTSVYLALQKSIEYMQFRNI